MLGRISDIEGIGPALEKKLAKAKIRSVSALLGKCADKKGRKSISEITGITEAQILKWTNMADLFRVKGISGQYAEILKAAGVDTVKELRNRNVENLYQKLVEVNEKQKLVRLLPGKVRLSSFIDQAKKLKPIITY